MKSRRSAFRCFGSFLLLSTVLTNGVIQCRAATLTVTSLADSGPGTLRAQIAAAASGDTIQFGVLGTVTLNSQLMISKNLRIDGGLASLVKISGNNNSRVFNVSNAVAHIFNVTIADGRLVGTNGATGLNGENVYGGGIFVDSTASLDLENCIVSNNLALGGQGGPTTEFGSAGNGGNGFGGGVASLGTLTMIWCTLVGNSGTGGLGGPAPSPGVGGQGWGGGMYLEGTATIYYSTIYSNNAVAGTGGGGPGGSMGGGINNVATLTVYTSTIASNTATGSSTDSGGGINNNGTLTIRDCTIVGNQADYGGGLTGGDIGNTILAGNSASSPVAGPDASGLIVSSDYNLVQNTSGITFSGTTTHNITGVSPLLGPLQYNGGPNISYQLPTMAPLPGSPVIDKGYTTSTADQRGFVRPYDTSLPNAAGGNGADIGAIEIRPTNLWVFNNNDVGPGSLRQAILDNNGLGGGNTIMFSNNVTGTITLTSGELAMTAPGQVAGPGASVLAVSGNHNGRVFDILLGPTYVSGLTIRDGLVIGSAGSTEQPGFDGRGGGIYNQGYLVLSGCVILSNSVVGGMGGSTTTGTAGNGGKGLGGGLYNAGGNLTLAYCTFEGNTSTGGQGGSATTGFAGYAGNGLGGAVCTIGSTDLITACGLMDGLAKGGTGGVASAGGSSGVGGQGYGGGLYSESTLTIRDSTLGGNSATAGTGGGGPGSGVGGGGYSFTTWGFTNCTIANNTANGSSTDSGGGLHNNGTLAIFNSTIAGNQADYGGGLDGNATMGNTILAGNTASIAGSDGNGMINSYDYNLIQTFPGLTIGGATAHVLVSVDPKLGPLANNGGPTLTMALLPGSPAIDQGKNFAWGADQRELWPRPWNLASIQDAGGGDGSDIGAFEYLPTPRLNIQPANNNSVVLSWSTDAADFALLTSPSVPSNNWVQDNSTRVPVGNQIYVTNTTAGSGKFYRLGYPLLVPSVTSAATK